MWRNSAWFIYNKVAIFVGKIEVTSVSSGNLQQVCRISIPCKKSWKKLSSNFDNSLLPERMDFVVGNFRKFRGLKYKNKSGVKNLVSIF